MSKSDLCPYCLEKLKTEGNFCPYCGNRLPSERKKGVFIGRMIGGHYKITDKIGEGGMGYVFKARHTLLDKNVAIKVLREDFVDNPEAFERFRREAKNTSRLSHPNAVTMYDFGQTEDGLVYIILEFIEGSDLRLILDEEKALSEKRAVPIFLQICDALNEAHKQKIIHRDLKSENIMLTSKNDRADFVKVLDFGIAKLMNVGGRTTGGTLTQKGVVFGTPQYMCPEQVKGEKMDQRSDLYALGIIMYEVLAGDVPFMTENPVDIMVMQVKEKPKPIRKIAGSAATSKIEKIIEKCLEKKPQSRYQSARELKKALLDLPAAKNAFTTSVITPSSSETSELESTENERPDSKSEVAASKRKGFKLINVDGLDAPYVEVNSDDVFTVGRHSSNSLVVKLAQVSKFHAEIHFRDDSYILVDRGSLNGSFVNGEQVKAEVLKDGDLIEFSRKNGLKVKFKANS